MEKLTIKSEISDNKETQDSYKKIIPYICHIALLGLIFLLLYLSMKYLNNADNISPFFTFHYTIATIFVWIALYLILKGITNSSLLSVSITAGIEIAFDIMNYIVLMERGSAITISDILAIPTALSVASSLHISFAKKGIIGLIFVFFIILIISVFRKSFIPKESKAIYRFAKILVGIAIFFILSLTNIYKSYSLWDINETYRSLGTPLTILRMIRDINVHAPENYNRNEASRLLSSYGNKIATKTIPTNATLTEEQTNIIVIINESFCDYYNLYKEGYLDPISYFTELSKSENVISGVTYSSGFGGQTSNVEYEFLTQNSIRILPIGSYVFQQFITSPVKSSLVSTLKDNGYRTSAIHPWESFAYSRNKIYKLFGFDSIKFKDDIDGLETTFNNDFFTDKSTYQELLKEINQKDKNEKIFEYVLTVQNHIGYNNPDPNQITYHDENTKNVYMQLIHNSSEALEELINELKSKDEKYLLLFFGDHQPNLDEQDNFSERDIEAYETPFIIWANYDIKEQYDIKTSTVFLQNYLLKTAGIKFTDMNNYMEDLEQYFPIITKNFCIDINGNMLKGADTNSPLYNKLIEYNKINYYRIFDSKK